MTTTASNPSFPSRRAGRSATLAGLALLTACAGAPKQTFYIDAIDTDEKPVPCLVVVGDDWDGAATNQRVVNVAGDDQIAIDITFETPEVSIICAAVRKNESTGEVDAMPKSRTESTEATTFVAGTRRLRATDAPNVLFILERKY